MEENALDHLDPLDKKFVEKDVTFYIHMCQLLNTRIYDSITVQQNYVNQDQFVLLL
jgi:hypothetical protein